MDEGFNTFINTLAANAFNNGEYANVREFQQNDSPNILNERSENILTIADLVHTYNFGAVLYVKPAFGLQLLREKYKWQGKNLTAHSDIIHTNGLLNIQPLMTIFIALKIIQEKHSIIFWRGWFPQSMENGFWSDRCCLCK
jgi:hypothetical protein